MTGSEREEVDAPNKTRILSLDAEFSEDHKRVLVRLKLSDAGERPTAYLALIDSQGKEIRSSIILELMFPVLNFTLHLGNYPTGSPVRIAARIVKDKEILLDEKTEVIK